MKNPNVLYNVEQNLTNAEKTRAVNNIGAAFGSTIAVNYSELTFPVEEGTFCVHEGKYYYCSYTGGIQEQEDWDQSKWSETSVSDQIGNVEALLAAL